MIIDDVLFFEKYYGQCNFLIKGEFVENGFLYRLDMLPDDFVVDIFLC